MKYVRVMDGLKSNSSNYEFKLDEINNAEKWNPKELDPEKMGGFNFSTEDKILRWLHRGTVLYEVMIPKDAEVIVCDEEKGIYRTNKIIITNPRIITDELVLDLCYKTTLSDKIIAQCLETMLWKNRINISKYLIKQRVNSKNITEILKEFEDYVSNGKGIEYKKLHSSEKEIFELLQEIKHKNERNNNKD